MTLTPIQSLLPDKAKIEKFNNVKSKQDLEGVFIAEKFRNNYWTAIPNKILFDAGLSHGAKVLWAILQCVGNPEGFNFYGQKTLAELAEKSNRTIQRYANELKEHGWLEVKSSGYNSSNDYFVIWPPGCQNPKKVGAIKKSKAKEKRY